MMLWLTLIVLSLTTAGTGDQVLMELQTAPCYPGGSDPSLDDCVYMEERQGKRAGLPLPCSCVAESRLLDLGHLYYPRYLPSAECPGTVCYLGHYRCRPSHYEVKVLKRRDVMDEISRHRDESLPEPLRELYQFVLVKVVVACECSL